LPYSGTALNGPGNSQGVANKAREHPRRLLSVGRLLPAVRREDCRRARFPLKPSTRRKCCLWQGTRVAIAGMDEAHEKAYADFTHPSQIYPKLTVAYAEMIILSSKGRGGRPRAAIAKEGLAVDQASYLVRDNYLGKLMPRWGGSYAQIATFIEDTKHYIDRNPDLRGLLGYGGYARSKDA
jgi:hypothetical protein